METRTKILLVFLMFVILCWLVSCNEKEHLTVDNINYEAIQNIASVYNSKDILVVPKLATIGWKLLIPAAPMRK